MAPKAFPNKSSRRVGTPNSREEDAMANGQCVSTEQFISFLKANGADTVAIVETVDKIAKGVIVNEKCISENRQEVQWLASNDARREERVSTLERTQKKVVEAFIQAGIIPRSLFDDESDDDYSDESSLQIGTAAWEGDVSGHVERSDSDEEFDDDGAVNEQRGHGQESYFEGIPDEQDHPFRRDDDESVEHGADAQRTDERVQQVDHGALFCQVLQEELYGTIPPEMIKGRDGVLRPCKSCVDKLAKHPDLRIQRCGRHPPDDIIEMNGITLPALIFGRDCLWRLCKMCVMERYKKPTPAVQRCVHHWPELTQT